MCPGPWQQKHSEIFRLEDEVYRITRINAVPTPQIPLAREQQSVPRGEVRKHESSNQLQPGGAKCRPALSSKQDHYARGGEEHRAIQEGLTPVAAVSPELRQQKGEDGTPEATPERYECDCRDGKAG